VAKVVETERFGSRIYGFDGIVEVPVSYYGQDWSKDLLIHHLRVLVWILNYSGLNISILHVDSTSVDDLQNICILEPCPYGLTRRSWKRVSQYATTK
jgi:hypothetical protein